MQTFSEFEAVAPAEHRTHPAPPFVVDLDGTLVKTDLLMESLAVLLRQTPWHIMSLPFWLSRGRARFKQEIARRASLDAAALPYRRELLDYIREQRALGRTIVLATAANAAVAQAIAEHLKLFDVVFSSDGTTNLCGELKRDILTRAFGEKGFDYVGDAVEDVPVWASAREAIAVNPGWRVRSKISGMAQASCISSGSGAGWAERVRALRPHHWIKNILLFVPLLAAHRINEPALVAKLMAAFTAFVCIASGTYLLNDVLDLTADRHHPDKRLRPFASGNLPLDFALWAVPLLFSMGFLIAVHVSRLFLGATFCYLALSLTYSLRVRKVAVLDVTFLAGLYTLRILAGSAAIEIWPSHWLLAMSTFLFFSMALVKRYGELAIMRGQDGDGAKARGYEISDGELLASMGIASGYLAVMVLALYISSDKAHLLYGRYQLMWFLCPLLLYWISHVWLVAHRGRMPDDPVVFALHDRPSWILVALMIGISVLAL